MEKCSNFLNSLMEVEHANHGNLVLAYTTRETQDYDEEYWTIDYMFNLRHYQVGQGDPPTMEEVTGTSGVQFGDHDPSGQVAMQRTAGISQ